MYSWKKKKKSKSSDFFQKSYFVKRIVVNVFANDYVVT